MSALRFPWGVEGYLQPREGEALYALALTVPAEQTIVELGTYKGRSAICLAQSGRRVVCVDHFEGERLRPLPGVHADHIAGEYERELHANLAAWVPEADVRVEVARTSDRGVVRAVRALGPIGMVFVDGDHSLASCRADVEAWAPVIEPGGLLVFHDSLMQGPATVIAEMKADGWEAAGKAAAVVALRRMPAGVAGGQTEQRRVAV